MYGYNSPFFDWLRQQDRMATNDPNALTPAMAAPDTGFTPAMWSSGSPAGDDGGIMGGGSLAKAGGWSNDQVKGGMAAAKGLGDAINAATGYSDKPMPIPRLDDNTAGIRSQASQMWQQIMQKKPRGLI